MVDHIDTTAIPGANLRPDMVQIGANEMKTIGTDVSTQGGTVLTAWQGLAAHYEAPESGTLFHVMDKVKTDAETFGTNVSTVSKALNTYAAEVEPIKAELAKIKTDAENFVTSIAGGVEKKSYSRAGVSTSKISWDEDQASVDKNNSLIHQVNAQMVLLWAAERKCANAIYDIIGWSHVDAATNDNPNGYGVTEIPDGADTPWGKAVKRTEGCGEKAADAVGHFVWDGVIVGGIWGTVKGLGSLTLGYNPNTGEWFDGSTYGAAWGNLGKLAVGLTVMSIPGGGGTMLTNMMPGPVGDFLRDSQTTVINAGKGLIAWDKWKTDPAAAAGEATFNIATIIIPAAAEIGAVKTSASTAAAAIRGAAKVIEVIDPASVVIKLGAAGVKIAMPVIADLVKTLDFSKLELGGIETGGKIEFEIPSVEAKVDVPAVNVHDITVDTGKTATDVHVPVRDLDTATVPVREPVTVGVGGGDTTTHLGGGDTTTHVGGHDGGSTTTGGGTTTTGGAGHGGGDLPTGGDHPTGGGDPTTGDQHPTGSGDPATGGGTPDGPTGGGGHPTNPWDPSQGDPVLSQADHGPGFDRDYGNRGNPVDPNYGQPTGHGGHLANAYLPPDLAHVPAEVRELVTDPGAPFGRDAVDHHALSQSEWESRYLDANNRPIYPGNDGAVVGRRIDFSSTTEFEAHYGDVLDRMGREGGDFMSFPDTPFEQRSLPGSNLSQPYLTMRLTGDLPPGVHFEVSEVAPAFGQPGGGLQVRVLDGTQAMTVTEMRRSGILEIIDDTRWPADWPRPEGGITPHYTDWSELVPR